MDLSKYDGNIHPDEWINQAQRRYNLDIAISLVDPVIVLPPGIDDFEKFRNALKEDISFTIFKNTNKYKLQSLEYVHEKKGCSTSKFISTFRKLCYNAEINDMEEQKKYFRQSLYSNNYFIDEFFIRQEKIKSMNDLIKEFGEIVADELNSIKSGSIVTLKHVSTGKYLSSIQDLNYTTGSNAQLVCFSIVTFIFNINVINLFVNTRFLQARNLIETLYGSLLLVVNLLFMTKLL